MAGAAPFIYNLHQGVTAASSCADDLNDHSRNLSRITCSSECYDHDSTQTDVQDIGSSWFALACYLSVTLACINIASFPYKQSITQCLFGRYQQNANPETCCNHPRFSPQSWLTPIAFLFLAGSSFALGGYVMTHWLSALDINAELGLNCSPDAPFSMSKRHLREAAHLCIALGVATCLPILCYSIIVCAYNGKACKSARSAQPKSRKRHSAKGGAIEMQYTHEQEGDHADEPREGGGSSKDPLIPFTGGEAANKRMDQSL